MHTELEKSAYPTVNSRYLSVPEGTLILGENRYYSRDCYKTQLNNNVLVVGTSGCGKTRSIVMPNLMQATGSYVVSDPKGNLYKKFGPYLKSKGYEVITMDFIHPGTSNRYNPMEYCRNTTDILKVANVIVHQDDKEASKTDPYWDESTQMCLLAILGYIFETDDLPKKEKTLSTLRKLVVVANREEATGRSVRGKSCLQEIMENHKKHMQSMGKESWAYERFQEYNTAPDKTLLTTNSTTLAKLVTFATEEVQRMLSANDIDFATIGQKPTALFVQVSDTDRSMDLLVNLFYTQLMNELCTFADDHCENSCLPVPVQFILDDFATNARIDNFENMIANIRSRGISAMLMVQSEAQLQAGYGTNAQTIIDNCNTYVYMGGSDPGQAKAVSLRANKTANSILNMPLSTSWIFRRGEKPVFCHNFDLEWFKKEKGFEEGKVAVELNDERMC